MENNFIQMAVSAGHTVAYTIGPIFKHKPHYRLCATVFHQWLVGVTLIFDGTPQIIVQRCQIEMGDMFYSNGVFFSTIKCAFYLKKMQFCVCFLKRFRPLKG